MGRLPFLFAIAALSACGGTSVTGPVTVNPITDQNIVGRNFGGNAAQTRLNGTTTGSVGGVNVQVRFLSTTQVQITVAGATQTLTYDPAEDLYLSNDQTVALSYAIVPTSGTGGGNMVVFTLDRVTSGNDFFASFVGGNRTPASNMPTSGTATYTGQALAFDGTSADGTGTVTLTANFGTGAVGGTIGAGILPSNTSATFTIAPTQITDTNRFSTAITGSGAAAGSLFEGNFYGGDAEEAGGTVRIVTSGGNAAGFWVADRN